MSSAFGWPLSAWSALGVPLRRLYHYLFKRLLGHVLAPQSVDHAQLEVSLAAGDVRLHSLHLNVALLSAACAGLPVAVQAATVEEVHAHVPWTALLTEPCRLHVKGLRVTLTPSARVVDSVESESSASASSSVLDALSADLQDLDPAELRQQLRLHRQLAHSLSSQGRKAQAAEDRERRTAEAQRRSGGAAGRSRRTAPEDGDEDGEADGDEDVGSARSEDGEAVTGDVASAGLAVVASFLERLVSTTELSVEDVTISVEVPYREEERVIALSLHVNSLSYSDLPALLRPQPPPTASGPQFSYRKRVAVHGFRVTLAQPLRDSTGAEDDERGREHTIAHADVDQQCEVRLRVDIAGEQRFGVSAERGARAGDDHERDGRAIVDASVHVRTVRALLAPHQLELLRGVVEALTLGSHDAARALERRRAADRRTAEAEVDGRGGTAAHVSALEADSGTEKRAGSLSASAPLCPPPSAGSSLPLWSVELRVSSASLTVLEEDESVRPEWWLQPIDRPSFARPSPSSLLSPLIANITVDHILLSARGVRVRLRQTSAQSSASWSVARLSAAEYLQQLRLMRATVPTLVVGGAAAEYEERQQRVGFSARRLLSLGDDSDDDGPDGFHADLNDADCAAALLRCDVEAAVMGFLPPPSSALSLPTAVATAAASSRVLVQLAPAVLEMDLGLMARAEAIVAALRSSVASVTPSSSSSSSPKPVESPDGFVPSSAFALLSPRVRLVLLFPADTPSQAGVATPLMNDGVPGCFDSRGKVRGERLELSIDALQLWQSSRGGARLEDADVAWSCVFGTASVLLVYPKEERQVTEAMRRQRGALGLPAFSNITDPTAFHHQCILTTKYDAEQPRSAAQSSRPSDGRTESSTVTVLVRPAPLSVAAVPNASEAAAARSADALFLDSLPEHRWFESADDSVPPRRSSLSAASAGPAAHSAAPSAVAFEQSASAHSAVVVHLALSACTAHLSKVELDLLLLLYTIYDELTTDTAHTATQPTQAQPQPQPQPPPPPERSLHAEPSTGVRFADTPDPPSELLRGRLLPSLSLHAAAVPPASPSSSPRSSLSDSESDASDALFESVVGAQSVILRPAAETEARGDDGGDDGDQSDVAPLSDLDSDVDAEDDDVKEDGVDPSSSALERSVLLGRSQELRSADGRRVTARESAASLLTGSSLSSSTLFHSFLSAPPALRSSTVLPSVSLFAPAPVQPYKFLRPQRGGQRSDAGAPPHRHGLSLTLSIARGGLCVHEEPVPLPLFSLLDARTAVPPSSTRPPQSFYLDVSGLDVFTVNRYDGAAVSYVRVRAADATLHEYEEVIAEGQRWTAQSRPVLFRTMAMAMGERSATDEAERAAVFVGSFILRGSAHLHLRETTAVLNVRGLTLAFEPQSAWLSKLSDLFTLTAPPYVLTVGEPVQLSADYRSLEPQRAPTPAVAGPRPPPLLQELVHVHFRCQDCLIDHNPPDVDGRAALVVEHFSLRTDVHPSTREADFDMELRDAALFVLPRSLKAQRCAPLSLCAVPAPGLHRLPGFSPSSYLEDVGFARVATADYVDIHVHQQDAAKRNDRLPATVVEVTNGALDVLTCHDSAVLVLALSDHLSRHLRALSAGASASDSASEQRQQEAGALGDGEQKADQRTELRPEEKAEKDEVVLDECERKRDGHSHSPSVMNGLSPADTRAQSAAAAAAVSPSDDAALLQSLLPAGTSPTSLSLALQAAAERELERTRREREIGRSISELRRQERGREDRAANRPDRIATALSSSSMVTASDDCNGAHEQRARWFSRHELDERELRDALEDARGRSGDAVHEAEDDHRRKAEQQWDDHLDRETERRRERQRLRKGGSPSAKYVPLQPRLVEDHVAAPHTADDRAAGTGRMGSGRRALQRLLLLPDEESADGQQPLVADVELLLYDVSVRWTLFDGTDWEQPGDADAEATEDDSGPIAEPVHVDEQQQRESAGSAEENDGGRGASMRDVRPSTPPSPSALTIDEDYVPEPARSRRSARRSRRSSSPSPSTPPSPSAATTGFVTPAIPRGRRSTERVMELRLSQLNVRSATFPPSASTASSLSLDLGSLDVVDCVATSHFRKFLCTDPRALPRTEQRSNRHGVLRLEARARRADGGAEAWQVDVALRPLRLNVDQDAAELLVDFAQRAARGLQWAAHSGGAESVTPSPPSTSASVDAFRLSYPVHLCLDYRPRRLSLSALSGGDYSQLLHLFPIEALRLTLKPMTVSHASVEQVAATLLSAWVDDIGHHQLHRYLSSIQPLRSLVNVGQGVVDCVVLPLEQLRTPRGRVVHGVRRGVGSLVQHVTVEGLNLLLTATQTAQSLLEGAEHMAAGPRHEHAEAAAAAAAAGTELTPKTLREGMQRAYDSLSRSLRAASHQLVALPSDDWTTTTAAQSCRGGRGGRHAAGGARGHRVGVSSPSLSPSSSSSSSSPSSGSLSAGSVVRAMPAVLLGPMIGLTDGLRKALQSAQHVVQPTLAVERDNKYKRPTQ